jgi:hypothetical protein
MLLLLLLPVPDNKQYSTHEQMPDWLCRCCYLVDEGLLYGFRIHAVL